MMLLPSVACFVLSLLLSLTHAALPTLQCHLHLIEPKTDLVHGSDVEVRTELVVANEAVAKFARSGAMLEYTLDSISMPPLSLQDADGFMLKDLLVGHHKLELRVVHINSSAAFCANSQTVEFKVKAKSREILRIPVTIKDEGSKDLILTDEHISADHLQKHVRSFCEASMLHTHHVGELLGHVNALLRQQRNGDKVFISVGATCYPRIHMKRSLNISREGGYRSCPFDLLITPFEALIDCIRDNFAQFFDDLHLTSGADAWGDRSKAGPGGKHIRNAYGMVFVHESPSHSHKFREGEGKNDDEYYIRNGYAEFKAKYQKRIANFRHYIQNSAEVILLYRRCVNFNPHLPDRAACESDLDIHSEGYVQEAESILDTFRRTYPFQKFDIWRLFEEVVSCATSDCRCMLHERDERHWMLPQT